MERPAKRPRASDHEEEDLDEIQIIDVPSSNRNKEGDEIVNCAEALLARMCCVEDLTLLKKLNNIVGNCLPS